MPPKPAPKTKDFLADTTDLVFDGVDKEDLMDRAKGCLAAHFLGESIGSYLEFSSQIGEEQVDKAMLMEGGGWFNINPGQITDDGEIAISLLEGLIDAQDKGFDLEKIALKYRDWIKSSPFDKGITVGSALENPTISRDNMVQERDNVIKERWTAKIKAIGKGDPAQYEEDKKAAIENNEDCKTFDDDQMLEEVINNRVTNFCADFKIPGANDKRQYGDLTIELPPPVTPLFKMMIETAKADKVIMQSESNGGVMRISPLAIYISLLDREEDAIRAIEAEQRLTHPLDLPQDAAVIFCLTVRFLLRNKGDCEGAIDHARKWIAKLPKGHGLHYWWTYVERQKFIVAEGAKMGWLKIAWTHAYIYLRQGRDNLHFPLITRQVMQRAGDTDTNGAIVGMLVGAAIGFKKLQETMPDQLNKLYGVVADVSFPKAKRNKAFLPGIGGIDRVSELLYWAAKESKNFKCDAFINYPELFTDKLKSKPITVPIEIMPEHTAPTESQIEEIKAAPKVQVTPSTKPVVTGPPKPVETTPATQNILAAPKEDKAVAPPVKAAPADNTQIPIASQSNVETAPVVQTQPLGKQEIPVENQITIQPIAVNLPQPANIKNDITQPPKESTQETKIDVPSAQDSTQVANHPDIAPEIKIDAQSPSL
jgi:ADP-ribosylglycohydrolase